MKTLLRAPLSPTRWSERATFIVRQGIVRYGVAIGLAVTLLGILPDLGDFGEHWAVLRVIAVLLTSWAFWALVIGWIIGAFRWSLRERRAPEDGRHWPREGTSS